MRAVVPSAACFRRQSFHSPGVDAGDYVYVSGQGPRRPDGSLPATFAEQVRQALDNVKSVVEAAGLTMDHVVYTPGLSRGHQQISRNESRSSREVFPKKTPPARAVLGVAKLPEPAIQINAVAVRNLAECGPCIRPATSRTSQPRRASSPLTGCLFRACRAAILQRENSG